MSRGLLFAAYNDDRHLSVTGHAQRTSEYIYIYYMSESTKGTEDLILELRRWQWKVASLSH